MTNLRHRSARLFHAQLAGAFRELRQKINMGRLMRALRTGSAEAVLAELPIDEVLAARLRGQVARVFLRVYQAAGDAATAKVKASLVRKEVDLSVKVDSHLFDVLNPRGLEFLQRHGAELVTQVAEQTKAAIRAILVEGTFTGLSVVQQARQLRGTVGLTAQHMVAVERLRAELDLLAALGELTAARAARLVAAKARDLLTWRTLTIARTEASFAASAAQQESWKQAADEDLFDATEATQVWLTADESGADDDIPCDICEPMRNQEVPFGGMFTTGKGELVAGPPVHPNCMCDVVLRPVGRRQQEAA